MRMKKLRIEKLNMDGTEDTDLSELRLKIEYSLFGWFSFQERGVMLLNTDLPAGRLHG